MILYNYIITVYFERLEDTNTDNKNIVKGLFKRLYFNKAAR